MTEDAGHDAEVAEDRHQDDPAQDPDLQEQHGLIQRRIHLPEQPGSMRGIFARTSPQR